MLQQHKKNKAIVACRHFLRCTATKKNDDSNVIFTFFATVQQKKGKGSVVVVTFFTSL
jgi:hypothetical protein